MSGLAWRSEGPAGSSLLILLSAALLLCCAEAELEPAPSNLFREPWSSHADTIDNVRGRPSVNGDHERIRRHRDLGREIIR